MTDNAFLFHVLEDGKWHSQSEILRRSEEERGCRLTVNSRAAELRKKHGCKILNEKRRTGKGRIVSYYRMDVALDEQPAASGREAAATGCSSNVLAPASAAEPSNSTSPPLVESAGTLLIFECNVDESAGLRGAYWDDAA